MEPPRDRIDQPEPPDIDKPDITMPPDSPQIRPSRRERGVERPEEPGIEVPKSPEVDEPDRREREERPEPERPTPPE